MEPRTLSLDEFRDLEHTHLAVERMDAFGEIASKTLKDEMGNPNVWDTDALAILMLHLWTDYDPTRPN